MSYTTPIDKQIAELEATLKERRESGVVSESISTPNGGSRSLSYDSLASLEAQLQALYRRRAAMSRRGAAATCYYPFGGC